MAGGVAGTSKTNAPRARKRVEVDSSSSSLKRAEDGSAFTRCEKCNKQLAVALMDLHDCLMESQIMKALDAQKAELERQSDDEVSAKDDFRKSYKETNPDCKSVSVVAKEGGERWKSMADEEKMAYVARAAELKAEYGKALNPDNADDGKGSLEMEVKVDSE
ncbi:high mobility group B protein 7-like isoform X2 [Rhododendron vialii]|uniref:high mobility group B protein 7-like isoform X2 n=1 Tax=Rhododendron vialii TaxID=182163 RepID=UPI00265D9E14|nr:high mobility group B protein 7-like isoform X2 [Rhododendron vialii]